VKTPLVPALSLFLFIASIASHSQEAQEAPRVTSTALKSGLHLLQGRGGNVVASIGEDGVLMIDDDYGEYAEAYHEALRSLQGSDALPRFIVNTHWHGDHTGSNAYWAERGAVIVAQDNVYQRMSTRQEIKAFGRVVEPSPRIALPVVTYTDSSMLRFNNEQIELMHLPNGHTDGDTVVFFVKANLVHTGDLFFKDRYPFVDIDSGGNAKQFAANVAEILQRVDEQTVIVPGHGSLAQKADLERYLEMLKTSIALVTDKLDSGMTLEQITSEGLDPQWSSWGEGFIDEAKWIGFIARGR
jgi:glyoxylase-like metal-dependent hydrolase (beta-lactamase superfamily II)